MAARTSERRGETRDIVSEILGQITDQVVYGAKFVEQFEDARDTHWVLTRAPLDCVLDATESVLLSYRLEIEALGPDIDTVIANIRTGLQARAGYGGGETVGPYRKLATMVGGLDRRIPDNSLFGSSAASPGDIDGDGVPDLVVGAPGAPHAGYRTGGMWILFLRRNGTVRASRRVTARDPEFHAELDAADELGSSLAGPGDLDRDGLPNVVVGARGHDAGGFNDGAVWILSLTPEGAIGVTDGAR